MKSKQEFTSVITLLVKAGHRCFKIQVSKTIGNFMRAKKDYVWFPSQQIIVSVDTNTTYQVRKGEDGLWYRRINRKNGWIQLGRTEHEIEFVNMIEPHYVRYLNDLIMEDTSNVESKGCSVQSSDS